MFHVGCDFLSVLSVALMDDKRREKQYNQKYLKTKQIIMNH